MLGLLHVEFDKHQAITLTFNTYLQEVTDAISFTVVSFPMKSIIAAFQINTFAFL